MNDQWQQLARDATREIHNNFLNILTQKTWDGVEAIIRAAIAKSHEPAADLAAAENAAYELFRANGMLTQQLADEREKAEGLERANRGLYIESNERYQQLLSAQAEIEKHNKQL
jgi:hypothetical protein